MRVDMLKAAHMMEIPLDARQGFCSQYSSLSLGSQYGYAWNRSVRVRKLCLAYSFEALDLLENEILGLSVPWKFLAGVSCEAAKGTLEDAIKLVIQYANTFVGDKRQRNKDTGQIPNVIKMATISLLGTRGGTVPRENSGKT